MRYPLLWLAVRDLRQTGWRSGLTALSLAVTIVAISVLEWQAQIQQTIILRDYESAGATTFLADAVVPENEIDDLERAVRELNAIAAVEAPYRGSDIGVIAETAFLVFENKKQQNILAEGPPFLEQAAASIWRAITTRGSARQPDSQSSAFR